jgi:hypothetical protein
LPAHQHGSFVSTTALPAWQHWQDWQHCSIASTAAVPRRLIFTLYDRLGVNDRQQQQQDDKNDGLMSCTFRNYLANYGI